MNRKLLALVALCMLGLAGTASALEVDLVAVSAMPLAVADVVALPSVPVDPLMSVISTLNRAAVPAPQFIEVVRYAPVAIIEPVDPPFTTYVTQQYDSGVVGEPLALAIDRQYDVYGYEEVNVLDPPVVTVVEQRYVPDVVVTRFQPVEFDPLALVAMPLAVAAVADLVDVPQSDLFNFVASLNRALVPAPQFVEMVRYSPVMFVDDDRPRFMQFVTTQVDRGIVGAPLAYMIAEEWQQLVPAPIDVYEPEPYFIADRPDVYFPPVVATTVARAHPHGGPPGQLKKELGLQTGAEVVHGSSKSRGGSVARGSSRGGDRRLVARDDDRVSRAPKRERKSARAAERRSEVRAAKPRQERRVNSSGKQKARVSQGAGMSSPQPVVRSRGNSGGGQSGVQRSGGGSGRGNSGGGGGGGGRGNSGGGKGNGKGKG